MANIAYLLISATEDDASEQKHTIQDYAGRKNLRVDNYISVEVPRAKNERSLRVQELFSNVNRWDVVIVSDLARVGHDIAEIGTVLRSFSERGVRFIAARQDMDVGGPGDGVSKVAAGLFDLLAGLEKDLASTRIKRALSQKRRDGVVLGRPKGSISSSRLDGKRELIIEYLSKGVSKASLARILDTSPSNLLSYLRTRKIEVTKKARPAKADRDAHGGALHKGSTDKDGGNGDGPISAAADTGRATNHFDILHDVLICRHCGKNILDPRTTTCAGGYVDFQGGESFHRIPYPEDEKERCPRCGVSPGGFHHEKCYIERCPRCGERLVSCACRKLESARDLPSNW